LVSLPYLKNKQLTGACCGASCREIKKLCAGIWWQFRLPRDFAV
jgi:hypothetical protein